MVWTACKKCKIGVNLRDIGYCSKCIGLLLDSIQEKSLASQDAEGIKDTFVDISEYTEDYRVKSAKDKQDFAKKRFDAEGIKTPDVDSLFYKICALLRENNGFGPMQTFDATGLRDLLSESVYTTPKKFTPEDLEKYALSLDKYEAHRLQQIYLKFCKDHYLLLDK